VLKPRGAARGEGVDGRSSSSGRQSRASGREQLNDEQPLHSSRGEVDLWAVDVDDRGEDRRGGVPAEDTQKRQWGSGLMKQYTSQEYKEAFPNRDGKKG